MLGVTIQDLGTVAVISCPRRIVAGQSVHALRQAVLAQENRRTVVLNLGGVDAVDCAGLGLLVFLQQWAQAGGIDLLLANPRAYVRELLELMKLDSIFKIISSEGATRGMSFPYEEGEGARPQVLRGWVSDFS